MSPPPKKHSKSEASEETRIRFKNDDSIARLARDFIQKERLDSPDKTEAEVLRTSSSLPFEMDHETRPESFFGKEHPVQAAFWGLIFWGGTFLYFRKPLTASFVIVSLALLTAVFGVTSGLVPSEIIHSNFWSWLQSLPAGPILLGSGFGLALLWWLSILLPVLGLFSFGSSPSQNAPLLFATFGLPMIGHYLRGKVWFGHLQGLSFFLCPVSFFSLLRIWNTGSSEVYFLIFGGTFLLSFTIFFFGAFGNLVHFFREIGWLRSMKDPEGTQWLFVILGSWVILGFSVFVMIGTPREKIRPHLIQLVESLKTRNFTHTQTVLEKTLSSWDEAANWTKEQIRLFQ